MNVAQHGVARFPEPCSRLAASGSSAPRSLAASRPAPAKLFLLLPSLPPRLPPSLPSAPHLGVLGIPAHHCCEAVLLSGIHGLDLLPHPRSPVIACLGQELEEVALDLAAVQLEGIVAVGRQLGVVAVEWPIA